VEIIDELMARIVTTEPAGWLPSQLAVWFVLFPDGATPDSLARMPVGSGPYRFESLNPGTEVVLRRNPDYTWPSPKGMALAEMARFRFVPEPATRIADLETGDANIVTNLPPDQFSAVEDAGGQVIETAILGTAFLRLATDVAPFDDPRVGIALNHAVDVDALTSALVSGQSRRLASIFPDERGIGFDAELAPFTYDPARARALLDEAEIAPGLELRLEFVSGEHDDVLQAIAAQLAEVGITVTLESLELATFNGSWQDPESAPLRFVSWRPVFDPHTLLSLMFASGGPLSRHRDDVADELIRKGATEPDPDARGQVYQTLGQRFQEAPPAVFLWNLTSIYGVKDVPGTWTPRGDEYVIPTQNTQEAS
jgi:peptide/nickel transport system substrate-binding protein